MLAVRTVHPEDAGNSVEGHHNLNNYGKWLSYEISNYAHPEHSILEIGCNSGVNLNELSKRGYTHLRGIDINEEAVRQGNIRYPHLRLSAMNADNIDIPQSDIIFTCTCLMHLHPEIIRGACHNIADKAKKYVITLENESMEECWSHYPRDYKRIFESKGYRQIKEKAVPMLPNHVLRVFKKGVKR